MLHIYSIYDSKAQTFNTPWFARNDAVAMRQFEDLVYDEKSVVHMHPEDFTLYELGLFNDEDGQTLPARNELISARRVLELYKQAQLEMHDESSHV